MINKAERFITSMPIADLCLLRSHIERLCEGKLSTIELLLANGYERTSAPTGLMQDGREVISVFGDNFVLNIEEHGKRAKVAIDAAKEKKLNEPGASEKIVAGTDALDKLVCPRCGDNLQRSTICGGCALGKMGYRYKYICASDSFEIVSKDKL